MKSLFMKIRNLLKLQLITIIGILFFIPVIGFAQNRENELANKVKLKKATRVFYGQASFYANKFNGRRTANGEIFSQKKLTCACNVLPLGTWIKVTNLRNRKSVIVKTNDRIHPKIRRVVDLSKAAADKLGFVSHGLTRVKVELVDKKDAP
ncbi:MAG: septal ring lytic transglycosylase RlpA family protein [Ferruginibacter sp.]